MENFTPLNATMGGLLIGLSAALLFYWLGKIAGISGILGNMFSPASDTINQKGWMVAFLIGLIASPLAWFSLTDYAAPTIDASIPLLIIGGLLVGFGTRLGGGCTSGHGVCGIARLSKRSMVATVVFMAVAVIVVWIMRHGLMVGG